MWLIGGENHLCEIFNGFCTNFYIFYWFLTALLEKNKYVGPPYCQAEMYDDHGACRFLLSHGEYADGTDRRTDVRPLHYAFHVNLMNDSNKLLLNFN